MGDHVNNHISVIVEKYWNPFLIAPMDHIKKPIMAYEVIVFKNGAVCAGKRPLSAISKKSGECYEIPHDYEMPPQVKDRLDVLKNNEPSNELLGLTLIEMVINRSD
jgi:hypothetical protein